MSEQKPKKPFLKRGTRQFLSNAQVRSLNQKPRIVEFNDEDFQQSNSPFVNSSTVKKETKQEIVIAVKPKNLPRDKSQSGLNSSKTNTKKANNLTDKTRQTRNETNIEENVVVNSKPQPNNSSLPRSSSQKKPTLLADYLNNDSKPTKKPVPQAPIPAQIPKTLPVKPNYQPPVHSQAKNLKMQDIDDDSDEDHHIPKSKPNFHQSGDDENQFIAKRQKSQSSPEEVKKAQPIKKKPNLLQEGFQNKKQKQNLNIQNQKVEDKPHQNEVNFHSDSDSDDKNKKNQFKTKAAKTLHQNRFKEEVDQNEQAQGSDNQEEINRKATVKLGAKPQSKVAQMFNKGSNQKASQQVVSNDPKPVKSKMTIDDVPNQLIEQLVEKYFNDAKQQYKKKQQNLFEQVKVVEKKQDSLNEQEKNLEKRVKEFEKQMEQKNKEFEAKIKNEQNKISREKMYLKDQQTTGKADFKTKQEIQQLKQQLEEQRNERKRIEVKLRGQLDRLKARYNQDLEVKKNLENRIKEYELRDIKERQIKAKQQKQQKQQTIQKKKSFWEDAPKQTYLQRFYAKDFTLSQFPMDYYFYQNNEFYKYYKEKGDSDVLQMEQNQGQKIRRTYENGKVEIESIKKFVKEIFPWGYTIVHFCNGDVKQIIELPKNTKSDNSSLRMEIYYCQKSEVIEYLVSQDKLVHYFLKIDNTHIQLKDQSIDLQESYYGNLLVRNQYKIQTIFQKKANGKFLEKY